MQQQQNINTIIAELNEPLSKTFQDFEGVYLYGSRLKGTYKEDSDIDLVAIFQHVDRAKRMDIWGIVGKIEAENNVFLDLHPMTMEELKENPYHYEEIVNNGRFYKTA